MKSGLQYCNIVGNEFYSILEWVATVNSNPVKKVATDTTIYVCFWSIADNAHSCITSPIWADQLSCDVVSHFLLLDVHIVT